MGWTTDFRVLPGGCTLGALALATSPLARETEEPLYDYAMRRARGKYSLNLRLCFDLWVLAHYESAASKETVSLVLPKILDAQREDGLWQFEPYTGRGAVGLMISDVFRNPICATYRVLETLYLSRMLSDLVKAGKFRADPFFIFQTRDDIGTIVARRDFQQRPEEADAQRAEDWIDAILTDQSPDGSWQGSLTLTAYALQLLADLHAEEGIQVKCALKWLRRQFRHNTTMPPYDPKSRKANPVLSTFGATTDPLAELETWGRITGTTGKLGYQGACWRRIPRELKSCTHPEMVAAAERLLRSRPDLPGGEQ